MAKTATFTLSYSDDSTRKLVIDGVNDSITAADVKTAVLAVNASLTGGTSDGLNTFLTSNAGANLSAISDVEIKVSNSTNIVLGGE